MTTAPLVIGVDGGGTKTDVVVADLHGVELGAVQTTGTNHEGIGTERVVATLRDAIGGLLDELGAAPHDVAMAVFGLAGIDWTSDVVNVGGALAALELGGSMLVVNDSAIALRAGCSEPWGIVSSVGTGTVTAGVNRHGERFRTMAIGWGEPSGSHSMVSASLNAVASAYHGTGPATALTEILLDTAGCASVPELFEALTRGRLSIGAGWAPLLDRAVDAGDEVATDVLERIAERHADMVGGVARHLAMEHDDFDLVMSGGVHQANARFADRFRHHVHRQCPGARPALLAVPPVRGAVQLAMDALASHDVVLEKGVR